MVKYPDDWKKIPFDKSFEVYRNNTCSRALMTEVSGIVQNIHYGDVLVKYGAILDCQNDKMPYLTEEGTRVAAQDYVQDGDVIIADTAEDETCGKVVEIVNVGGRKVVAGLHTVFCRPKIGYFTPGWLGYWMNSRAYHDQLHSLMTGIKVLSVSKSSLSKTYILAPKKDEQKRIATVLGNVDKLIDNLLRQIEKKRLVKQGVMQDLLTGKKRLPGFAGEWRQVIMGKIGSFYGGLSGKSSSDFNGGNAKYITFMNVLTNVVIDREQLGVVSVKPGESQNLVQKNDLFFNGSSETPEEVAMCAALLEDMSDTYLNSFCCGFRLSGAEHDPLFISYYFNSPQGRESVKNCAQGLTRYNLSKQTFLQTVVNWPVLAEQKAIAKVLSDMDAEITKLEAKYEKYRHLKQGLMDDLLTGKVRIK